MNGAFNVESMVQSGTQGEYGYRYRTDLAPNKLDKHFAKHCAPVAGGCKQFNVNSAVVDDYASIVVGVEGRVGKSTSTELFGGAFKARGDGALQNPNALSEAWMPSGGYHGACNKKVSERTFDRWSCMGAPLTYEPEWWNGSDTRQSIQYISKC